MQQIMTLMTLLFLSSSALATPREAAATYDPSPSHPWGRPNPDAPPAIADFRFMIGNNDCTEQRRNNSNGEWIEGERTWDARYTMNGHAIIDSGRSGASANANIRAFDADAGEWVVTFFSMPGYASGIWRGRRVDERIVLKQAMKAPGSGIDGFSTLTFSNISDEAFDWDGTWVSADGSIEYPFWRIRCRKADGPT